MRRFLLWLIMLGALPAMAANPEAVAISSIAVTSGTVTVTTSAAHGLSATLPSGFCITGSSVGVDNVCQVVVTTPLTTNFTFPSSVVTVCSSSCGSVAPAPRVINIQVSGQYTGNPTLNYVCWLATETPLALTGFTSQWKANAQSAGPTAAQVTALSSGYFIEVSRSWALNAGVTTAQMNAYVVQDWTSLQSALTSSFQPSVYYGYFWDGSANWQLQ